MPLRSRPARRVLPLFAGAVVLIATAFAWLGWRLVHYEETAAVQRLQQRLDAAADLADAALLRHTTDAASQLAAIAALPAADLPAAVRRLVPRDAADARLVVVDARRVDVLPSGGLAWYPPEPLHELSDAMFAAADGHEFARRDPAAAVRALDALSADRDPAVRAAALVRLGRNLQKAGQPLDAVRAYDALGSLGETRVGGLPSDLVARYARCALFEKLQQRDRLEREAAALHDGLRDGRWRIDRATYLFYLQAARGWLKLPSDDGSEPAAVALADAVESIWTEWNRLQRGDGEPSGMRAAGSDSQPLLVLWRSTPGRLAALIAAPAYVERSWLASVRGTDQAPSARLTLLVRDPPAAAERSPILRASIIRDARETGLPWRLHVASADPQADAGEVSSRRRFLIAALALVGGLLIASTYAIERAISRELQTLRIQSDFLAAVSHEFRSPLTSMRQMAELLASGRVASDERRGTYYRLLMRESRRLHRLVESLLDFGRAEAGAGEYRREPLDLATLVRETVNEFRRDAGERGFAIDLSGADGALPARGDAEALERALWNLLDNAVKYSPDRRTVWVTIAREAKDVRIAVRDEGTGIPAEEIDAIFGKFVRGAAARASGAKGTGLGLAMVRHIARGHNGDIAVASAPGAGSTFTLTLPIEGER